MKTYRSRSRQRLVYPAKVWRLRLRVVNSHLPLALRRNLAASRREIVGQLAKDLEALIARGATRGTSSARNDSRVRHDVTQLKRWADMNQVRAIAADKQQTELYVFINRRVSAVRRNWITINVVVVIQLIGGLCHTNIVWAETPVPVAHRGLLRHAPENTLPAFAACLELGMGFELDIRTTKDGQLVVLHDDSVERTTNGPSRSIREMTLKEVRRLDAGSWFDPAFAGVRVPTLEETLAVVKSRKRGKTIIALNIKQLASAGEAQLVSLVEKYGLLGESFAFDQNAEMSRRLKSLNPKLRIGRNVNRQSLDEHLREDALDVFLLTFAPTSAEVERLRQHKKQVLFNYAGSGDTRRNSETWKKARAAGIDGMLTDYPLECRAVWRASTP